MSQDERMLEALDTYGIPFLVYDRDGLREYASESALRLLGSDPGGHLVWHQASRLAKGAFTETPGRAYRVVPSASGACALAVHVSGAAKWCERGAQAVIVLHPTIRSGGSPDTASDGLTVRERQVAQLIALGRSTKELAAQLSISCHTARHHTERIFAKLGARSRTDVALIVNGKPVGSDDHSTHATRS